MTLIVLFYLTGRANDLRIRAHVWKRLAFDGVLSSCFRCGRVLFGSQPLQRLRHLLQHARLIQVQMQGRLQGDGPRLQT